jgi:hypothetical protein
MERSQTRRACARAVVLAILVFGAALAAACGPGGEQGADRAGTAPGAIPDGEELLKALRGFPRVMVDGELLSIHCTDARRVAILSAVARRLGAGLAVGDVPDVRMTLDLEDVTLEEALDDVVEGIPYEILTEDDPETGETRIAKILVGDVDEASTIVAARSLSDEDKAAFRERLRSRLPTEERRRIREEAAARDAVFVAQLASESVEEREAAVLGVSMLGPGREAVVKMATQDPSPSIRRAAVTRIEEIDMATAREVLHQALTDSDPDVVLSALSILEYMGDDETRGRVEPLAADHPDERVREEAARALRLME